MLFRITKLVFAPLIFVTVGISPIALSAPAQAHEELEVTYQSGAVEIAATLLRPKGIGPFPAVVVIHGSGPSKRLNAWTSAYVNALVQRGVAVLYPD
jgi:dipeptidyl aminopeptidase/acylaminoacyl peptidase